MSEKKMTDDGYQIIPPVGDQFTPEIKGIQCGQCGMKFDHNKAYGYACQDARCPIQPRVY